ncbi:MAG TPA: Wzz/FepE/Etk N-terminal domain-containing protein [Candidatus Sulfotelmatobacter sp.]
MAQASNAKCGSIEMDELAATRRELTFEDHLAILRRGLWVIVASALLGLTVGYLLSITLPEKYVSHTSILVNQPAVSDSYVKPVVSEDLDQRLASMREQILGRTRLQHLVEQFGLYEKDGRRVEKEELVERLRKSIAVTPLSAMTGTRSAELPGFSVDVTMGQARLAQQICIEITSLFVDQNLRLHQQQAEDMTQFLAKQLEEAKVKLDEQDAKLAAFQSLHLGELPEDEQTNLDLLMGMPPRMEAATQSLNQAQQDKAFAESLLSQRLLTLKSSRESGGSQSPEQQVRELQNELHALQGHYTQKHPDVVKLKKDIAELQKKLQNGPENTGGQPSSQDEDRVRETSNEPAEIQQLRARLHQIDLTISQRKREQEELQRQTKALESKIQSSPGVKQQFKALTREHQIVLDFYNDLLRKVNEAQMATELENRQQGEQFRVLDPPSLPERPSFPSRSLFSLCGLGAGMVLGLGMVHMFELRKKCLWTEKDVEFYLREPTLALIPSIQSWPQGRPALQVVNSMRRES